MGNATSDFDDESYSSLPRETFWEDEHFVGINGFWVRPARIHGINQVLERFKPQPTDVILASFPKTGTTWLKSLLYAIVNRSSLHSLASKHPHLLVPSLEFHVYDKPEALDFAGDVKSTRIFATQIPYQLLADNLESSDCRVVYVTRNPKDTLISAWHFYKQNRVFRDWPSMDVVVDGFCHGIVPYGPYYDHVLGYWKRSSERPDKVYVVTYEELKDDARTQVKKLAEFLGCPFGDSEEAAVEEIVKSCSFDVLSKYEVNRGEEPPPGMMLRPKSFFRRGEVGDHKNDLTDEMIERIDAVTRKKFHGSGLCYGI